MDAVWLVVAMWIGLVVVLHALDRLGYTIHINMSIVRWPDDEDEDSRGDDSPFQPMAGCHRCN